MKGLLISAVGLGIVVFVIWLVGSSSTDQRSPRRTASVPERQPVEIPRVSRQPDLPIDRIHDRSRLHAASLNDKAKLSATSESSILECVESTSRESWDHCLAQLTSWLIEGDLARLESGIRTLLLEGDPNAVVDGLIGVVLGHYNATGELMPRGLEEHVGQLVASVLARSIPPLDDERRNAVVDARIRADVQQPATAAGVLVAVSLGGAIPGDALAIQRFVELIRADDAVVSEVATLNLGFVASPSEILSLGVGRDPNGILDESDARLEGARLLGLLNGLGHHPEQADIVIPIFEDVLMHWYETDSQNSVRADLLRYLASYPVERLRPVYELLSSDETCAKTSRLALAALAKLDRNSTEGE